MSISGLVITLVDDGPASERAEQTLSADPRLRLGPRVGCRLAVVADTPSPDQDNRLWQDLHSHVGIQRVDVVYVGVPDDPPPGRRPAEEARP